MKRRAFAFLVAMTALLCAAPLACKRQTAQSHLVASLGPHREVRAVIDGPGFIQPQSSDTALVTAPGHKILVTPTNVLVDAVEAVKLSAAATNVQLTVADGQLSITADGTNIVANRPMK